jgi:hypothetical protein
MSADWLLVFPEIFLRGTAPRLQFLSSNGIAFLGIQKLLLTANHLVLHLLSTSIPPLCVHFFHGGDGRVPVCIAQS